jgi:hypothetical protein
MIPLWGQRFHFRNLPSALPEVIRAGNGIAVPNAASTGPGTAITLPRSQAKLNKKLQIRQGDRCPRIPAKIKSWMHSFKEVDA